MAQTAGLIFTNDSGAGGGTSSYVTDTLPDYTFQPNVNAGFSSTVSNNPWNNNYANTDLPQYGSKYLPIKDLIYIQDRTKWINNKTTYQVIFYENYPQVQCYIFGNISITRQFGQTSILLKTIGDGISVNGVIRQVAFVVQPNSAATATAQVAVDGANQGTIDFSSFTSAEPSPIVTNNFAAYLHNTTAESYNIHDIRLTALQASTLALNGVIVYFQGPNSVIDQFPGTSYVNKTKVLTTTGISLAIPSFGSSLGGNALVYKTSLGGYTISALSSTTIASLASGASGTNLLNLSVGTGASFTAGYGLVLSQGASTYVGSVVSVSTDTLTMGTTLGFGASAIASVYTAWKGGSTLGINASLMALAYSIDFSKINFFNGLSATVYEPTGNYALWGNNIGITFIDSNQSAIFLGASGFMQVDGYFSAAEIETIGNGIFGATIAVNGLASWSQAAGQTGEVKKTIFTDAGPGWNSFNIGCGASMGALGIQKINLYQRARDISVSFGFLSDFDIAQTYTNRDSINASLMALGGVRRVYADQLYFKNTWLRGATWTVPGGIYYRGASTNGSLSFQYYGTNFGVCATFYVGGTLTLDGAGVGLTANVMQSVATLGFHTIAYTGGTAIISAIDYLNPIGKSRVDAQIAPSSFLNQTTQPNPFVSTAVMWAGYHNTTSVWNTASATFADLTSNGASNTLITVTNSNFPPVAPAANSLPGITWTPPAIGVYQITATASFNWGVSGYNVAGFILTDVNGNKLTGGACVSTTSSSPGFFGAVNVIGYLNVTSLSSATVKLQAAVSSGTGIDLGVNGPGLSAIDWTVTLIR